MGRQIQSTEKDVACLRKVIRRRLANGEFKGMNVFSQESTTQECVVTPVRSFSKCLLRGRETVCREDGEKYWDLEKPCVWVNPKYALRRGKNEHYSVTILHFYALANIKSYCCVFFVVFFFPPCILSKDYELSSLA